MNQQKLDRSGPSVAQTENLSALNEAQQEELTAILDAYLRQLEEGQRPDVDKLTADHPHLAELCRHYIAKLNELHGFASAMPIGSPFDVGSSEESAGYRLGDFTIQKEIGRGGMGIVYEAHQRSVDRRVALKLLPMQSMLDARQIARFKNESQAAGQLQHPHIVQIYSVGEEKRIHYYAMQLIDGTAIDAWIRAQVAKQHAAQHNSDESGTKTDWRKVVQWASDVADALQCAHESGVVHRDIKPSNLLLDDTDEIWVTDFGLAQRQAAASLTCSGDMVGTMRYMSPEQASGKSEQVDHRTDIYSLGATVFEMLTLTPVVGCDDGPSMLRAIERSGPPKLGNFVSGMPSDLALVLQKAMSKKKDDRYESARQFRDDLLAVIAGRPTLAKKPSLPTALGRLAIRHRRSVTAAAAVMAVAFIGLSVANLIMLQKNREVELSAEREQGYFQHAHNTVHQFGSVFAEHLAGVPGTEEIRRALLTETLAYYQEFAAVAVGDPQLQLDLAVTHSRIGDLQSMLSGPGHAIDHYREAEDVFSDLASQERATRTFTTARAGNLNRLGLALAANHRFAESEAAYIEALGQQASCMPSVSDDSKQHTEFAITKNNLGLLYRKTGHTERAQKLFRDVIEHLDPDKESALARRTLSAALVNLSSLSLADDPQTAVALAERALDTRISLASKEGNRLRASAEVAMLYNNLGASYLSADRFRDAESAFDSAIELLTRLQSAAPLVSRHERDLAMCLNNKALAQRRRSGIRAAADSLRLAVKHQTQYANLQPNSGEPLSTLGAMKHNLAIALGGDRRQWRSLLESAVQHQLDALALDPTNPEARSHLSRHRRLLDVSDSLDRGIELVLDARGTVRLTQP